MCAVKHITLKDARDKADLTQQELEELSGIDRTRISKIEASEDANVLLETAEALETALRKAGGLKRGERLTFRSKAVA